MPHVYNIIINKKNTLKLNTKFEILDLISISSILFYYNLFLFSYSLIFCLFMDFSTKTLCTYFTYCAEMNKEI